MYVYTALQQRLLRPCQGITPAGEHQLSQARECRWAVLVWEGREEKKPFAFCHNYSAPGDSGSWKSLILMLVVIWWRLVILDHFLQKMFGFYHGEKIEKS